MSDRLPATLPQILSPMARRARRLRQRESLDAHLVTLRRAQIRSWCRRGQTDDFPLGQRRLADALHADGRCHDAQHVIRDALHLWRCHPAAHERVGILLLQTYLGILAGCGQTVQARIVYAAHADMLGPLGSHDRSVRTTIAIIIAVRAEHEHLVCEHPPQATPEPAEASDRVARWRQVFANPEPFVTHLEAGRPVLNIERTRPWSTTTRISSYWIPPDTSGSIT